MTAASTGMGISLIKGAKNKHVKITISTEIIFAMGDLTLSVKSKAERDNEAQAK